MLEKLRELGVEVDRILATLNGKQALYEKLVFKFYDMVKKTDLTKENPEELYEAIHALKGASGNLGLTPLFNEYVKILMMIKEGKMELVPEAMQEMQLIQKQILTCIEEYK